MRNHSSTFQLIAAELRSSLTPSEAALWRLINAGKTGYLVPRQVVIGRFIVDCAPRRRREETEMVA